MLKHRMNRLVGSGAVPDAPTIGTVTALSGTSVSVAFTAPADDGGAPIESYTATSSPGGLTGTVNQSGSGSVTVSGLNSGESYTFTVVATNRYGSSDPSSASASVTMPTVPGVPTITGTARSTLVVGATSETVNYSAPGDDGGATITNYQIEATRLDNTGTFYVTDTGGSKSVTGLTGTRRYKYRIRALNLAGYGAWSGYTTGDAPLIFQQTQTSFATRSWGFSMPSGVSSIQLVLQGGTSTPDRWGAFHSGVSDRVVSIDADVTADDFDNPNYDTVSEIRGWASSVESVLNNLPVGTDGGVVNTADVATLYVTTSGTSFIQPPRSPSEASGKIRIRDVGVNTSSGNLMDSWSIPPRKEVYWKVSNYQSWISGDAGDNSTGFSYTASGGSYTEGDTSANSGATVSVTAGVSPSQFYSGQLGTSGGSIKIYANA